MLNILLVEDCEDDAALLEAELRKLRRPLRVRRVECREEMRAALDEEHFDLVVSDHRLPRFDSASALATLEESRQVIPFLIVSGTLPEEDAANAMQRGARDFIDKAHRARLVPAIERELRHVGMLRTKERIERKLVRLTFYDTLTDLPNAHTLAQLVEEGRAERAGARSAMLVLGIDRFVRINESLGCAAGDEVLKEVASRLVGRFGRDATVARLAQDRFALFFARLADADEARRHAVDAQATLARTIAVHDEEVLLTCAVGVCMLPDDAHDASTLLQRAESAMLEAKRLGVGGIARAASRSHHTGRHALRLESALRHAVERNELFVEFQPYVASRTRSLVGTEALVRWRHAEHGTLSPDRFIPLADEMGLIVDIGLFVLREACRQNHAWQSGVFGRPRVAVNVSPAQFQRPGFADDVAAVLRETGLPPDRLVLEITESTVMRDAEMTIATLRRLKDIGVMLAVDDFGTGYSSLAYLKRFPIDVLKIDRSFVSGLTEDANNQAIVRTIIALARSLRLVVLAEGVETAAELAYLQGQGCDLMQGYLFGRPAPPERLLAAASLASIPR